MVGTGRLEQQGGQSRGSAEVGWGGVGRREDTMDLFHKAVLVAFPRPGMKAALEFGK